MMTTRDVTRDGAGTKLEMFSEDLVKGYGVPVRLPPGGVPGSYNIRQAHRQGPVQAPPSADRELAEQRLRDFLRQGRSLEQIVGRGTIRWVLTLTGINPLQSKDLRAWATQLFEPGEEKRRLEVREVNGAGPAVHVAARAEDVHNALQVAKSLLNSAPQGGPTYYAQNTIAHEFGHMLGLPDEYRCLSEQSRDTLRQLKFIETKDGFELQEWYRSQNKYGDDPARLSAPILDNQQTFLELCHAAQVQPPAFGQRNMSLMSAGTEMHQHHAVTVWECLCMMTREHIKPSEWKIEIAATVPSRPRANARTVPARPRADARARPRQ